MAKGRPGITARLQSLRLRVLVLVLLVLLPAMALVLYMGDQLRATRTAEVERNALQLARAAAAEEDRLIEGARQLLVALAELPEVRAEQADCSTLFGTLLHRLPQSTNLGAARPDGTVFCSGRPLSRPLDLSDEEFFARAVREKRFATSSYVPGRQSGRPSINIATPVVEPTGRIATVMLASIDLDWLRELARKIRLPPSTAIVLLGPDGTLLATLPEVDFVPGTPLPSPALLQRIRRDRNGTVRTAELGGVDRIYGFASLRAGEQQLKIVVLVGIRAEAAFAAADRVTFQSLLTLAILGAISLVSAWWSGQLLVIRPLRAMAGTAQRLQRGHLSARTGLPHARGELGALAGSIDEMAASLESTTVELRARANELSAIATSASAVVREQEIEAVAEVMIREMLSSLDADAGGLWLLGEDGRTLRLVAQIGFPERSRPSIAEMPIDAHIPTAEAARLQRVVIATNTSGPEAADELRQLSKEVGFDAGVNVPLLFRQKLAGVLAVARRGGGGFAPEQVRLATALGDIFAAAVENARLVRSLRESLWLREAFLAAAAHELRTPATSLKSYAQLLLRRKDERSERERHTLERMASLADRTAHLARELEEAHALGTGMKLRLAPVALDALALRVIDQVQKRTERHRLLLCAGGSIAAEVDALRVEMSLEALLENAIRYQPGGGDLHVVLGSSGGFATIEVEDFGVGIPTAQLPHVFEPLFEPWPPGSRWYTGVFGRGLYLARAVARAHGGARVVRREEGQGGAVVLSHPLGSEDQRGR